MFEYEVVLNLEVTCRVPAWSDVEAKDRILDSISKAIGERGDYDVRYEHAIATGRSVESTAGSSQSTEGAIRTAE